MSSRFSLGNRPPLSTIPSSRRNQPVLRDDEVSHTSDDEDSSSDISESDVRDAAEWALSKGMQEGAKEGPRSTTTFVAAPSCTRRWANTAWEAVKIIVPLSFAASTMYMTMEAELPMTAVALSTGIAGAGVYQAFAARFGREEFKDGLRVAFTQLSTQFVTTMSLRFGLEQAALKADPTLTATGYYNGTHFDAFAGNLTGNATEVYAIEHERVFPGGTAWLSLAALGLPAALLLQSFLFPPRHGTTALGAFVDRIRFDASRGPGKVRARWSDGKDKWIHHGAKVGIGITGLVVVGGLLAAGQRKLALRILANANLVMASARARDFTNMLMRGVSPGSPASVSWPDGGWARQQQIKIPDAVMQALDEACTDPDTGHVNDKKKQQATQLLKVWYRNLFIGGRASSMPIYMGASVFGLFIMRDAYSPSVGGIFASDFYEALSVAVPFSMGTAFTEGVEEPGWAYMVSVWAGMKGMPFEIARTPRNPGKKMAENLEQLSFTALLPGQNIVRAVFPSRYRASTVSEAGVVTISLDDRLELNAGIRSGQNLTTMMILTAAGASTDPQLKLTLFSLGVVLNGLTHFRGNVAAQILESGREARLLYDRQEDDRAHRESDQADRAGIGDEGRDYDVVVKMPVEPSDGDRSSGHENFLPPLPDSGDSSRSSTLSGAEDADPLDLGAPVNNGPGADVLPPLPDIPVVIGASPDMDMPPLPAAPLDPSLAPQ